MPTICELIGLAKEKKLTGYSKYKTKAALERFVNGNGNEPKPKEPKKAKKTKEPEPPKEPLKIKNIIPDLTALRKRKNLLKKYIDKLKMVNVENNSTKSETEKAIKKLKVYENEIKEIDKTLALYKKPRAKKTK